MNSQTRIADHVNDLTLRVIRDLRRHVDSERLTPDEIVRAERAVAMQLLTGKLDLFGGMRAGGEQLVDLGSELIDRSAERRYMIEPTTAPTGHGVRGVWTIRDMQTGETSGSYGSAAAASDDAEAKERRASA